jgi:hypothetical protein
MPAIVSAARAGSIDVPLGVGLRMLSRLIDTATNNSPVRAAAAPTTAMKNDCQSAGL